MQEKEVVAYVSKMFKEGKLVTGEENTQETVAVVRLDPEAAYSTVSVDVKSTMNTGNFTSVSFSVFMSVPCPMEEDQQNQAFEYCSNFCKGKIGELRSEVTAKNNKAS
jgi:hypothetical protein